MLELSKWIRVVLTHSSHFSSDFAYVSVVMCGTLNNLFSSADIKFLRSVFILDLVIFF